MKFLASCGEDKTLRIWNIPTSSSPLYEIKNVQVIPLPDISCWSVIAYGGDGISQRLAAAGSEGTIYLFTNHQKDLINQSMQSVIYDICV